MALDHNTNEQGIWRRFRSRATQFARKESGTVTVESVIILPLLLFGLQAMYAYFESYRHQSLALKANYAIADYLSRIPSYDQTMVDGLDELFEYMTRSSDESWVRVTVVECRASAERCNTYDPRRIRVARLGADLVWNSHGSNGKLRHNNTSLRTKLAHHIPLMYRGEDLIVVETSAQFRPTFAGRWTGIYRREFTHISVTSPREHDTLCWPDEATCAGT